MGQGVRAKLQLKEFENLSKLSHKGKGFEGKPTNDKAHQIINFGKHFIFYFNMYLHYFNEYVCH